MVRTRPSLVVFALTLLVPFASGDDAKQVDPWSFKSPRAVTARNKYDASVLEADARADELKSAARSKLIKDLEGAMEDATRSANLDDAIKIRSAIKDLKEGSDIPRSASDLGRRLIGAHFGVGSVELVFGKGFFAFSDWGDKRGTWKAITAQTIDCIGPDGAHVEYTFNPAITVVMEVKNNSFIASASRPKN
jgi:hypothetical protein